MRRPSIALTAAMLASLAFSATAGAIGPGGWDHAGTGFPATNAALNGAVYAMNNDAPGVLLVGGAFTSAGGNTNAARIARWNGFTWSAVGATPLDNGAVHAIAYADGRTFVGGTFVNAGGNANADFLAVWDGVTWAPFCASSTPSPFTASVDALQIIGNTLYVGGAFQNGGGLDAADYLLACDLGTGASQATVLADGDINSGIYALTADSNGVLYAGGLFSNMDRIPDADHVAAYDGSWHAMGSGPSVDGGAVDAVVRSLAANGTDVYVGTDSVNVGGIAAADHVAKWNGSAWSAMGSNTLGTDGWFPASSFVNALDTSGPLVFAAGSFQNANGVATADAIVYWDGATWRPIGSNGAGNGPIGGNLTAAAVFGGEINVGGSFTSAGGDTRAQYIATYSFKQPDARIALASAGPFAGNAIYSATAAGESKSRSITRGHSGTFYVSIQNDGLVAGAFTIKGTGSARGYSVHYYRGAKDITTLVKAGTYSTGAIAARGAVTIRMVVKLARSSARSVSYLVKATSTSVTPADAVKASVTAR